MTTPMDKESVERSARESAEAYLKQKDAAARLVETDKALEVASKTIDALNEQLKSKDTELATAVAVALTDSEALQARVDELEKTVSDLNDSLKEGTTSREDLVKRAESAETQLANISKDRQLEVRMAELVTAKVAKSGNKLEAQKTRVREMATEDYEAYKQDLVEMRAEIETALRVEAGTVAPTDPNAVTVPPPEVNSDAVAAGKAVASLDVEGAAGESIEDRFGKWGQALGQKIKNKESK